MLRTGEVLKVVFIPVGIWEILKERQAYFPYKPLSLLKGLILKHLKGWKSDSQLVRELKSNRGLAWSCGFKKKIPNRTTFERFILRIGDQFEHLFNSIVLKLKELGVIKAESVAIDSTHLNAYSRKRKNKPASDPDASIGCKRKNKFFFGYKSHILCDTASELPIAVHVSTGRDHDSQHAVTLIEKANKLFHHINTYLADAAYNASYIIDRIIHHQGKPIIDYANRQTPLPLEYKQRTSIERINSRSKESFSLNKLKVRNMQKVTRHCYLTYTSMLYNALAATLTKKSTIRSTPQ